MLLDLLIHTNNAFYLWKESRDRPRFIILEFQKITGLELSLEKENLKTLEGIK